MGSSASKTTSRVPSNATSPQPPPLQSIRQPFAAIAESSPPHYDDVMSKESWSVSSLQASWEQQDHLPSELRGLHLLTSQESDALLVQYTAQIFRKSNSSKTGFLDRTDFHVLVQSPTLNLNISSADTEQMFQNTGRQHEEYISFDEFLPLMRDLFLLYSESEKKRGRLGWQWFGLHFDDESTLPAYYNTIHNVVTYDKPPNYVAKKHELQIFQQIFLKEENITVTSYIDEITGKRMYLDWDQGVWREMSEEWLAQSVEAVADELGDSDADSLEDPHDKMERFAHPVTHVQYESIFEGGKRLYFDDNSNSWQPIPLSLECHVPAVQAALKKLEGVFPKGATTAEKLLALRQHNYKVKATIAWAHAERIFEGHVQEESARPARPSSARHPPSQEVQRKLEELETEKSMLDIELKDANKELGTLRQRMTEMEGRLQATVARESSSSTRVVGLEDRLSQLMRELEILTEGGNWKTVAEEKETSMKAVSDRLAKITTEQEMTRMGLKELASKLRYAIEAMKTKIETVRREVQSEMTVVAPQLFRDLAERMQERAERDVEEATKELIAKYRYEVRQRKIIYNKLQELRGNIRVFCRVRKDDRVKCVIKFPDAKGPGQPSEIVCPGSKDEEGGKQEGAKQFEFDRVYLPDSTQEEIFEDTEPIITSCVDGYNVCILAYGQTGSGKTFTMMGTPENEGVNRRAVRELLKVCEARKETNTFSIKISLLEIYNEKILDLLSDEGVESQSCDLRLHPETKLPFVEGLVERSVFNVDDVMKAFEDSDRNRHVAATKMNSTSSRSHLVLQLTVTSHDKISSQTTAGKLTLLDLAGSERIAKTEATGQRLVEAAAINKSLSALGQVFAALRTNQSHVPYRNSKLTHLLQDSLGGDAKTCLFLNVSPAESNVLETMGTLKFGSV